MAQKEHSAQIFNHDLRALRRARAIRRVGSGKSDGFLLEQTGQMAAEKIMDINRQFDSAAIIALPKFAGIFLENLPNFKTPLQIDRFDHWPGTFESRYDLIISGLVLQSRNDIAALIRMARNALQPDGLFLAGLIGGESLLELRRACFGADQQKYGGIIPRVAPMIDIQQGGALLSQAGLAQPVVDRDRIQTRYRSLLTMVSDLRDIGETNFLTAMDRRFTGRGFLKKLEENYGSLSDNGAFKCVYEILWLTGWAPHSSQQKPLQPGSADVGLHQALRNIKNKS